MRKVWVVLASIVVVIAGLIFVISNKDNQNISDAPRSVKIVASFYPFAEFALQVAGEKAEVINMVPAGLEPHDFEPSPQDIAKAYEAELFIFNGSGFDPWAEKISLELNKRGGAVVNMTQRLELSAAEDEDGKTVFDPHIWLDPVLAQKQVEIIRDTLKKIDPDNDAVYASNAERYLAQLSELNEKYKEGLTSCAIRDAVASHAAFGHLATRYNLNIVNIAGLSPDEEPSSKKVAEIAEFARQRNIKYIFFETLVSSKLADTIAREIGAETLVLNPVEGLTKEDIAAGKTYISIMEENLTNVRLALVCR